MKKVDGFNVIFFMYRFDLQPILDHLSLKLSIFSLLVTASKTNYTV